MEHFQKVCLATGRLLKFATLGFMFLGQLVDILLIATQVVTPSDGSSYVVDYYGASAERIYKNNETYLIPGD
ncbi:TM2 domain-containing protein [Elysia marginata]|uniref:TM2 domain-containing protein n=1 Tax=Elysia marginata TaxID=1093978 RepID=A0AAV4HBS4_9GAST|nr:TM2 domain-containing protein [Elysia marginata]